MSSNNKKELYNKNVNVKIINVLIIINIIFKLNIFFSLKFTKENKKFK